MKKFLLSVVATLSFAASTGTIMPYGAYIHYGDKSTKDYANLFGVYASYYDFPVKFELDGEYLKIKYKPVTETITTTKVTTPTATPTTTSTSSSSSNTSSVTTTYNYTYNPNDWNQYDLTFVAHYYQGYNWAYKAGIHNIFIDQKDNPDNYDKVLFGGVMYYVYLAYNAGVDFYYSMYDGYHVNQYTLFGGVNFGNYYAPGGSHYVEVKLNFINISDKNVTGKKNYVNAEAKYTNAQGPWATTIGGDIGKNAYKVENGGFVVYSLNDEYKGKAYIKVNYSIDKTTGVGVEYTKTYFKERDQDTFSDTYMLEFSKSF